MTAPRIAVGRKLRSAATKTAPTVLPEVTIHGFCKDDVNGLKPLYPVHEATLDP